MGKKGRTFAVLFFITAITAGIGFYLFYQKNQDTLAQQTEIERLSGDIQQYKIQIEEAEDQVKKSENEKKDSTRLQVLEHSNVYCRFPV